MKSSKKSRHYAPRKSRNKVPSTATVQRKEAMQKKDFK